MHAYLLIGMDDCVAEMNVHIIAIVTSAVLEKDVVTEG
jgi:hypothetical protein